MPVPAYVVHAIEGRARLRHPVFGNEDALKKAVDTLAGIRSVQEVIMGHNSILLTLSRSAKLASICKALEAALPELAATEAKPQANALSPLFAALGVPPHTLEIRSLLVALGLTAASALVGSGKTHVVAGALFGLLCGRHIWQHRKLI